MATKRMEYWDAGDFCRAFRDAARRSHDEQFRVQFDALADALEPMDREFCEQTVRCGHDLSAVMDEVQSIAARLGYCAEPRGFAQECSNLYGDVGEAIRHIETLRAQCFV